VTNNCSNLCRFLRATCISIVLKRHTVGLGNYVDQLDRSYANFPITLPPSKTYKLRNSIAYNRICRFQATNGGDVSTWEYLIKR